MKWFTGVIHTRECLFHDPFVSPVDHDWGNGMFGRLITSGRARPATTCASALIGLAGAVLLLAASVARAEETPPATGPLQLGLEYRLGVMAIVQGGVRRGGDVVDGLTFSGDLDLDQAFGWTGFAAHFDVMANTGGLPSDKAGSALGLNSNEVRDKRPRLVQAYLQTSLAGGSGDLLVGYYDIGSDFYALPAAGPLVGAGSGLPPELAASGPNGPSNAPETAFTVRLKFRPGETSYLQLMVADGMAGVLGDADGPDFDFRDGALIVGEAGFEDGPRKLAFGGWRFTRDQPDLRDVTPGGDPVGRTAQGAYILGQAQISGDEDSPRRATVFGKAGISDGATTPFSGSWTAGVRIDRLWESRPDSSLTFAVTQGRFTGRYRANQAALGVDVGASETDFELTYTDRIGERVVVQPDLQWIHDPSGDKAIDDALVVGLRFTFEL